MNAKCTFVLDVKATNIEPYCACAVCPAGVVSYMCMCAAAFWVWKLHVSFDQGICAAVMYVWNLFRSRGGPSIHGELTQLVSMYRVCAVYGVSAFEPVPATEVCPPV